MDYINVQFTEDEFDQFILNRLAGSLLGSMEVKPIIDNLIQYTTERCGLNTEEAEQKMVNCIKTFYKLLDK